jgi:hypothetical protein
VGVSVPMAWSLVALQTTKGLSLEGMGTDMRSTRPEVRKPVGLVDLSEECK